MEFIKSKIKYIISAVIAAFLTVAIMTPNKVDDQAAALVSEASGVSVTIVTPVSSTEVK